MGNRKPFNEFRIEGDVAYLVLADSAGAPVAEAMLDVADLQQLESEGRHWRYDAHLGYAIRTAADKSAIYMHRHLLAMGDDKQVDHINRNRLDNRRENLRAVSAQENRRNLSIYKNSRTGVRGVTSYGSDRFPFLVRVGASPHVFALKVRTLNIGRITASLARAQHWGAEAA